MEYVIHHLANALCEAGHEVTVIAERTAWRGIGVQHLYNLRRYGVPTRGLRSMGLSEPDSLLAILRADRKYSFDLIHCHGASFAGTRVMRAKHFLDIPVIITPHGEDIQRVPEINYGLRLDRKWDQRIRKNLLQAEAVTAISLSVQNELDFVDPSKVFRIPNGIHIADYGKKPSEFLREKLNLDDDCIVVLSVGRNHVKKGYDLGIKAVAELKQRFGDKKLHYVVVGKLVSQHAKLVAELSLQESVTLIEEVSPEEVRECYRSADIFFSPSIIEGLSLVSIEAIACGLPLVVTNVPGNEDIVRDTGAGIVVRTRDPADMARGLNQLVSDKSLRHELAATALTNSGRYDWTTVARHYSDVYEKVGRPRSDT